VKVQRYMLVQWYMRVQSYMSVQRHMRVHRSTVDWHHSASRTLQSDSGSALTSRSVGQKNVHTFHTRTRQYCRLGYSTEYCRLGTVLSTVDWGTVLSTVDQRHSSAYRTPDLCTHVQKCRPEECPPRLPAPCAPRWRALQQKRPCRKRNGRNDRQRVGSILRKTTTAKVR